jgi:PhnB protein
MMKTAHPVPHDRPALAPYLIVKDAVKAIDFYRKTFGATEVFRLTEPESSRVGHAELRIGDSLLMLADEWPDFGALSPISIGGSPVSLHLYVEDVDGFIARATAAGATILRTIRDEFYGDRTGTIADPFGHHWHIATRKEEVAPQEMQQRWNAMVG